MKNLYRWIPSLYVLEGLPFALVTTVSLVLLKSYHWNNTQIALITSLCSVPWFLKPLFAPLFEQTFSRRHLVVILSLLMSGLTLLLAFATENHHQYGMIIILFCLAFVSAAYDINADGFYIQQLPLQMQTHFIGMRTVFYHVGRLIAQGTLIYLAGLLLTKWGIQKNWLCALSLLALFLLMISFYHIIVLPDANSPIKLTDQTPFKKSAIYYSLVKLPNLLPIFIFAIIFLLAENQLTKIIPLFLMDPISHGGLGLSIREVSLLIGFVSIFGLLIGILLSSWWLKFFSFTRFLLFSAIVASLMDVGYVWLSLFPYHALNKIILVIFTAQFFAGFNNGAYMAFLLRYFGGGKFFASRYAFGTALMGLSIIIGGALSGLMQSWLGYTGFFDWIIFLQSGIALYTGYMVYKQYLRDLPYA